MSTLPRLPVFEAIAGHDPEHTAVIHSESQRRFTYGALLKDVVDARKRLESSTQGSNLSGQRIAFLVENSYDYVVTFLSIMASDAIALPLSPSFPTSELRYILNDSEAVALLTSTKFKSKAEEVLKEGLERSPVLSVLDKRTNSSAEAPKPELETAHGSKAGMMLYTSGTTNRPKGVLLPEATLTAQASSLKQAWEYSSEDHLLHVLPLHHIHGTVNAILTPLFASSAIEFMFPFNATSVWNRLAAPFLPAKLNSNNATNHEKITFLTVVPTIYNLLLRSFPELSPEVQEAAKLGISPANLRLNISGSAALPTKTKAAWTHLSGGNALLERYGMTEVGMALSCGLDKGDRIDSSVGWALPLVEVRLVDQETQSVIPLEEELDASGKEREGEIQLRGPTVFKEYWENPKATKEEFVPGEDGKGSWFKTGDIAYRKTIQGTGQSEQYWAKGPMFFIQGRSSVDIIKTGGEKVSALEVERELLSLPVVSEAVVVGLPSEKWGQKVAAVVVVNHAALAPGKKTWSVMDMRRALKDKLVNYKIPQELKILDNGLPKNAMGKVNKKALVKEIWEDAV